MKSAFQGCSSTGEKAVDSVDLRRLYRLERTDRPEAGATLATQLVPGDREQLVERFAERILQQLRRGVRIGVSPVGRLRDDRVDHPQLETMDRVGLERGRGLARLAGVAPEDRRTTLG